MKYIKCLDNNRLRFTKITVGKFYEVLAEYQYQYRIIDDLGNKQSVNKNHFETVETGEKFQPSEPEIVTIDVGSKIVYQNNSRKFTVEKIDYAAILKSWDLTRQKETLLDLVALYK